MCQICNKFCLILLKLRDYKLKDKIKKKPGIQENQMVELRGFEPPTFGLEIRLPVQQLYLNPAKPGLSFFGFQRKSSYLLGSFFLKVECLHLYPMLFLNLPLFSTSNPTDL